MGDIPPFCLRFFLLPPIYQTSPLTACRFLILKSHHPLAVCYRFYVTRWTLASRVHIDIVWVNRPIPLALAFLWLHLLAGWRGLSLNRNSRFRLLILDIQDCLCSQSMELCCSRYSSRQQTVCKVNAIYVGLFMSNFLPLVKLYILVKLLNFIDFVYLGANSTL